MVTDLPTTRHERCHDGQAPVDALVDEQRSVVLLERAPLSELLRREALSQPVEVRDSEREPDTG